MQAGIGGLCDGADEIMEPGIVREKGIARHDRCAFPLRWIVRADADQIDVVQLVDPALGSAPPGLGNSVFHLRLVSIPPRV